MAELNYAVKGSGAPLVILHGLFGSSKNWQSHARQFAEHFQVFTIDARNHGESFHADEMNYRLMADDVFNLLNKLGLNNCNVLGHSMGGKAAMVLAQQHPDLVARLIIADIAPVTYSHHYDDLINPILALRLDTVESRAQADQLLQQEIPEEQLRAFLLQNLVRDASGWRWRVNWGAIQREITSLTGFSDLPQGWVIKTPSLFIRGENSDYIGKAEIEVIKQHFTQCSIETLEAAGHWLHAEKPQPFNQLVLNFLLR